MAAGSDFTAHGRARMRQRGMSPEDIGVICYFGTTVDSGAVLLTDKDVRQAIECLERLRNRKAVLGEDGCLITVYWTSRLHRKAAMRRARANGQLRR